MAQDEHATPRPMQAGYSLLVLILGTLGGLIAGGIGGVLVARQVMTAPQVAGPLPAPDPTPMTKPSAARNAGWDAHGLADYLKASGIPVRVASHDGATYLYRGDKLTDVSEADVASRYQAGDVEVARVTVFPSFVEAKKAAETETGKKAWQWQHFAFVSADTEAGVMRAIRGQLSPK